MDEPNNIVSFRDAAPSLHLKKLDWTDKRASCPHKAVLVWPKEPILECKTCGAVVDPYQWIRNRCDDWAMMRDAKKFERDQLQSEIDGLKKMLRLIRGEYRDERERHEAKSRLMVLPPPSSGRSA